MTKIKDKNKKEIKEKNALVNVMAPEQLVEYMRFARSPWKTFIFNFLRGTGYGLGIVLGTAIVLTFIIYISNFFIDYPVIGKWLRMIGDSMILNGN